MPVNALIAEAIANVEALPADVASARLDEFLVVDVREPSEALHGFLPTAINVPRGILEFRASEDEAFSDPDRPLLIYSNASRRAALAARCLQGLGFRHVAILEDGIEGWASAGLPIE